MASSLEPAPAPRVAVEPEPVVPLRRVRQKPPVSNVALTGVPLPVRMNARRCIPWTGVLSMGLLLSVSGCGPEVGAPGSEGVSAADPPQSLDPVIVPDPDRPPGWVTEVPVYTMAQAERGEGIFEEWCGVCHLPSFFTGIGFRAGWAGNTIGELYRFVAATMPQDLPGRLEPQQYADALAYIFQVNRMPPGDQELPPDERELNRFRLELPR